MVSSSHSKKDDINNDIFHSENTEINPSSTIFEASEKNGEDHEKSSDSIWLEQKSFRITLISIFTALAVVLGYALAYLPNIEVFTLMIFLAGFFLEKKDGAIVGLMSSFIFVFFNPYGVSPLPLFAYQLFHYSLTGCLGGLVGTYLRKKDYFNPKESLYIPKIMGFLGIIGASITFSFDIITTLIGALLFYKGFASFILAYLSGLVFTTLHFIGNTLGFIFLLPGLIELVHKLLD